MAVNAVGQSIQLIPVQAPGNDLTLGAKPGDVLLGKLVDLLSNNRAIIQIQGTNLVAQLPETAPGQAFSKGDFLQLSVLQAQNNPSPSTSSETSLQTQTASPSLTLKLVSISNQAPASASAVQEASSNSLLPSPGLSNPEIEALLTSANLPTTGVNIQAAQSLSRYGMAVNASSLQDLIQTVQSLMSADAPPQSQMAAPTSSLSQPVLESLGNAETLLQFMASQPSSGTGRPAIQGLLQQIGELQSSSTSGGALGKLSAGEGDAAIFASPQQAVQAIEQAITSISNNGPVAFKKLSQVLSGIEASADSLQVETIQGQQKNLESEIVPSLNSPQSTTSSGENVSQAGTSGSSSSNQPTVTLQREVAAWLMRDLSSSLTQGGSVSQGDLTASLSRLSSQLTSSPLPEQLLDSAHVQVPGSEVQENGLPALQASVASVSQAFSELPLSTPVRSQMALASEFAQRDLPAPKVPLSGLSQESVMEAVAFLKARQLSPTRPAVEAVATQINEGTHLGGTMDAVLNTAQQLPQGFLEMQPQLQQAFSDLRDFLNQNGVQPDAGDVAKQIQSFVVNSGLNLEKGLLNQSNQAGQSVRQAGVDPTTSLKANLLKLQDQVQIASKHPSAQASAELGSQLDDISGHLNSAVNMMHTMQLTSIPTPAFDVTTVQLPVHFDGQLNSGQLSVYWKKGKAHEISNEDPVNVIFLLNTRGLGDVKVQLQVWKSECSCKVHLSDEETKQFVKTQASEFQASFAKNTPFRLNSLEITGNGAFKSSLGFVEEPAVASGGVGLNLTA